MATEANIPDDEGTSGFQQTPVALEQL